MYAKPNHTRPPQSPWGVAGVEPSTPQQCGDWGLEDIVGGAEVRSWGGRVLSIAFEHEGSTTEALARIRNAR